MLHQMGAGIPHFIILEFFRCPGELIFWTWNALNDILSETFEWMKINAAKYCKNVKWAAVFIVHDNSIFHMCKSMNRIIETVTSECEDLNPTGARATV